MNIFSLLPKMHKDLIIRATLQQKFYEVMKTLNSQIQVKYWTLDNDIVDYTDKKNNNLVTTLLNPLS